MIGGIKLTVNAECKKQDLTPRGHCSNLRTFRLFYVNWPIRQTVSAELSASITSNKIQTAAEQFSFGCASKGAALAKYATEGLPNKMLVREYLTVLPKAGLLEAEIEKTQRQLERNAVLRGKKMKDLGKLKAAGNPKQTLRPCIEGKAPALSSAYFWLRESWLLRPMLFFERVADAHSRK
jgi:hypothetical protein